MKKSTEIKLRKLVERIIKEESIEGIRLLESSPLVKHFQQTVKGKKKYFSNTPEYKKLSIIADDPGDWETWINFVAKYGIDVKYDNNSDAYIVTNSVR